MQKNYRKNLKIMLKYLCKITFYEKNLINRGEIVKEKIIIIDFGSYHQQTSYQKQRG